MAGSTRYCTTCGNAVEAEDRFCSNCGATRSESGGSGGEPKAAETSATDAETPPTGVPASGTASSAQHGAKPGSGSEGPATTDTTQLGGSLPPLPYWSSPNPRGASPSFLGSWSPFSWWQLRPWAPPSP